MYQSKFGVINLSFKFALTMVQFTFIEHQMNDGRKNATKNPWTSEEISALKGYFKNNISSLRVPGTSMIEDAQHKFTVLKARFWRIVKDKVYNLIVKERKK